MRVRTTTFFDHQNKNGKSGLATYASRTITQLRSNVYVPTILMAIQCWLSKMASYRIFLGLTTIKLGEFVYVCVYLAGHRLYFPGIFS